MEGSHLVALTKFQDNNVIEFDKGIRKLDSWEDRMPFIPLAVRPFAMF